MKKQFLAVTSCAALTVVAFSNAQAQLFSYDGERSNALIIDEQRNNLLISTDFGDILRFDLGSRAFIDPIEVSGVTTGLAIDPISGDLFAGQQLLSPVSNQGVVNRINLDTLAVGEALYTPNLGEGGSFDVAFASNGVGLVTTGFFGPVPLREINGVTGVFNTRPDAPGSSPGQVRENTFLTADASGRYILLNESNISSFPLHVYDSVADSFVASTDNSLTPGLPSFANGVTDISGSAGLVAVPTNSGVLLLDLDLNPVRTISTSVSTFEVGGLAFSPDGETLYLLDRANAEIEAYDTASGEQTQSLLTLNADFSGVFSFGRSSNLLSIDASGENLFIDYGSGFELINFATFRPFCEFTTPGAGGAVACSQVTTRDFVSDLDELTVTVEAGAVFNGFNAFRFDGRDITLVNEGEINGNVDFFNGESDDTLLNRGTLSDDVRLREGDDLFVNEEGGVVGDTVGLGRGDDIARFEAGSRVRDTAEIRLGEGNDLIVIEAGAIFNGRVEGGRFSHDETTTAEIMASGVDIGGFRDIDVFNLNTEGYVVVGRAFRMFTDDINLIGGVLRVDGELFADRLMMSPDTELAGTGAIGLSDMPLTIFGGLAAGFIPEIDTGFGILPADAVFNVQGDLRFEAGGALVAELFEDAGEFVANGLVEVSGFVDILPGARLQIRAGEDQKLATGENEITVLTADEGVNGEFSSIDLPANFVLDEIAYDADGVSVSFSSQFGAGLSLTPAASSVAEYLDDISRAPESDATADLLQDLLSVDDDATINQALGDLSAQAFAASDFVNVETSLALGDAVGQAIAGRSVADGQFVAWTAAAVVRADQDSEVVSSASVDSHAGLFGVSYGVSETFSIGAFAGAHSFTQEFDDIAARAEGDGFAIGAFAALVDGPATLSVMAALTDAASDLERQLTYFNDTARSESDLDALWLSIDGGYAFEIGSNLSVKPSGGVSYISSNRDEAQEAGAGVANLQVEEQSNRYMFAKAGVELTVVEPLADRIRPFVGIGVRYEILSDDSVALAGLSGETELYRSDGLDVERQRLYGNAGLSVDITDRAAFTAAYRGQVGDDLTSHVGTASLSFSF